MQTTRQTILIRREKIQRLIRQCFDAKEWAFLWADEGFKQQALRAETLEAMEEVSQHGALLLLKRDFPQGPNLNAQQMKLLNVPSVDVGAKPPG